MLQPSFSAETPPPGRVARRLRRLLEMSPAEIAHRAAERLRVEAERRAFGGRAPLRPGVAIKEHLREVSAPRFFVGTRPAYRGAVAGWLSAHRPDWHEALGREADDIVAHRVGLMGFGTLDLGPSIDWHRDPVTGERWAVRFFGDYDLVNGEGPDPKVVFELGRQGHLARLAAAYSLRADERQARECLDQMLSWAEQSPAGWGIHWSSSLDIALRALSWMTALLLLLPSASLTEAQAARVVASLAEQLAHVHRYPSIYSSPNTHLIGEAAALFIGGLFLEGLAAGAATWRAAGARLLLHESRAQVRPDGAYGEPSTYYHAYALDFYLLALAAARSADDPLAGRLRGPVERMADYLAAVSAPDGVVPRIGDDDGGTAFPLAGPEYTDARDLLSCAALACDRPDLFREASTLRALWLFGPEAVDGMARSARARTSASVPTEFPHAGVFLQTMRAGARPARLIFGAGDMGIGGRGHAHADALQVLWDVGGRPILVDSGTAVYNRAPEWRRYFRGTRAHNTVTVDDLDQTVSWGTFAWAPEPRIAARATLASAWCRYAGGEHDGYRRLPGRVRHRRHVVALESEYWLIADVLEGTGTHRAAWTYHFAADLDVVAGEAESLVRVRAGDGATNVVLAAATSAMSTSRVVSGAREPIQGWVSARYGERRPAPVLEIVSEATLPVVALTLLFPHAEPPRLEVARGAGALVMRLQGRDGSHDEVIVQSPAGASGDELIWRRRRGGAVTHRLTAGARGAMLAER